MNHLVRLAATAMLSAVATCAAAAELIVTIQRGDEVRTITTALAPGQTVSIDERKRVDFKAFEGCADVDTSTLASSAEVGLRVKIDAVQDMGSDYRLRIGVIDTEFLGTSPHEFRAGCMLHMPQTTTVNLSPTLAIVPKAGKTAKQIASSYSAAVGKPISVTLKVK